MKRFLAGLAAVVATLAIIVLSAGHKRSDCCAGRAAGDSLKSSPMPLAPLR
jgi:hypothetical protein